MKDTINEYWTWLTPKCEEIKFTNDFANIIFTDKNDHYWRIIPEELKAEKIADNEEDFNELLNDEKFCDDWNMDFLAQVAYDTFGETRNHQCYGFKVWPAFDEGQYSAENMEVKELLDYLAQSGEVAKQFAEAPKDKKIEVKFED